LLPHIRYYLALPLWRVAVPVLPLLLFSFVFACAASSLLQLQAYGAPLPS
jgi:hypothetical protein